MIFHSHQFEPYHLTEILYYGGGKKPHMRVFEACIVCGECRCKDLEPEECLPSILIKQSEEL